MNKGDGFVLDAVLGKVVNPGAVSERHELVGWYIQGELLNQPLRRMEGIAE